MKEIVLSMAFLRVLGALLEVGGAFLMVRSGQVDYALRVNALLGLAGPLVLVLVTTVGLVGYAEQVTAQKLALVVTGTALILLATAR